MIVVEGLCIQQGDFELKNIHFTIPKATFGVLMGRSGCGKTTILEAVCGLRTMQRGKIILDGRDVTNLKPGERGVGYVPQDHALFPTMVVREQLAFSLLVRKTPQAIIAERVEELADLLGIESLLNRNPLTLSGGEAQRVALGRALACRPTVLCLDEPLNALDEDTHDEICILLSDVQRRTGVTALHITHSRREARRLGDGVLQLANGRIMQATLSPEDVEAMAPEETTRGSPT